jgi:Caspase domain
MNRQALIISYPGEIGSKGYCPGVLVDVVRYKTYLMNSLGGAWKDSEIDHLPSPTTAQVKRSIDQMKALEYTIIVFTGHGYHSSDLDSTMIELNKTEFLDSNELRKDSTKRTIILDCCRKVHKELIEEELKKVAFANEKASIDRNECRKYFDDKISKCSNGIIVAHSCAKDEVSGDSPSSGGYYSSSLLKACELWIPKGLDLTNNYRTLSVVEGHDLAIPRVRQLSGGTQNPEIEKPRSEPHFPFAIWA